MKEHVSKLVALAFVLASGSARSQTLNWASFAQSSIVNSHGDPLDGAAFVFQLGAFKESFVPQESNLGQWLENWVAFDSASYSYDAAQGSFFSGSKTLQSTYTPATDPTGSAYTGMFEGLSAYIWIRNTANTEYFLATAESWKFPTLNKSCCPTNSVTWSVSDLGNENPVWGGQNGYDGGGASSGTGPYDIQTHAVPEAACTLLGLLGCGPALLRRRRK